MNFPIKLICLDVDGTLADENKAVPQKNIEAIRWAHFEKGVHIAVLSGRIEPSVRNYMDILGINEAVPSLNGCLVRTYDGKLIEENLIDPEAALGILEIAKSLDCAYFYYHHDRWCLNPGHDYWLESEQKATGIMGTVTDLESQIRRQTPNKILGVNSDPAKTLMLKRTIEERYGDKVDCVLSTALFLEIMPKGVNKGTAVDALCRHYNITRENVMAVGDYYNDVAMFRAAGVSVSMANAPKDIQEMTTYTTINDNGHCGVAEAIGKFIV